MKHKAQKHVTELIGYPCDRKADLTAHLTEVCNAADNTRWVGGAPLACTRSHHADATSLQPPACLKSELNNIRPDRRSFCSWLTPPRSTVSCQPCVACVCIRTPKIGDGNIKPRTPSNRDSTHCSIRVVAVQRWCPLFHSILRSIILRPLTPLTSQR